MGGEGRTLKAFEKFFEDISPDMCRLYELTDYQQALDGWTKWFEAAKALKCLS